MSRFLAFAVIVLVVGLVVVAFRSGSGSGAEAVLGTAGEGSEPPNDPAGPEEDDAVAAPAPVLAGPGAPATADPLPSATALPNIPNEGPHRPLRQIEGWLQSDVSSLEELRGKIVVVQFWTFGCSNCKNTLPNLIDLYGRYGRDQVEFVGIHAPEFSFEADPNNIVEAAADLGVTWPIVLDTDKRTFHDWQEGTRAFWPRTYVLDRDGNIRFDHIGEGAYDDLNQTVADLVAHPSA